MGLLAVSAHVAICGCSERIFVFLGSLFFFSNCSSSSSSLVSESLWADISPSVNVNTALYDRIQSVRHLVRKLVCYDTPSIFSIFIIERREKTSTGKPDLHCPVCPKSKHILGDLWSSLARIPYGLFHYAQLISSIKDGIAAIEGFDNLCLEPLPSLDSFFSMARTIHALRFASHVRSISLFHFSSTFKAFIEKLFERIVGFRLWIVPVLTSQLECRQLWWHNRNLTVLI